jgi:hypothetical protein
MSEPLNEPIDRINDERPLAASEEGSLPVFITSAVSVFMIVVLIWLFVPGRVSVVRARSADQPSAEVIVPSAQQVHEMLDGRTTSQQTATSSQDPSRSNNK